MAGWPARSRMRGWALTLTGLVALVGVAASVGVWLALVAGSRRAADLQLDQRASLMGGAVATETGRYVDTVRTLAAAAGAFEPLTARRFQQLSEPLRRMHLAGASSLVFIVPASDAEIHDTQRRWRDRGATDLRLTPAPGRAEHLFVIFSLSLDDTAGRVTGLDVTQSPAPTRALLEARRTGEVTVSDTYQLLRDRNLPAGRRQLSFALVAPVLGLAPAPDSAPALAPGTQGGPDAPPPPAGVPGARPFLGWVLMGLHGQDFVGGTLDRISQGTVDVSLRAYNVSGAWTRVASLTGVHGGRPDVHRRIEVPVAQRSWVLEVGGRSAAFPGGGRGTAYAALIGGLLLSAALAALVYSLATARARAQAKVVAATAQLTASEGQARRQAGLLEAVMNSISDGVAVVDADGRFLIHNPAAKRMLGVSEDTGDIASWQRHYGVFLPDGRPFPTQDMPLVRALHGHSADSVEMLIRNAGVPDGATITVSARPLVDADQPGAVAVFHDSTQRRRYEAELRARQAELTRFAGVVAHDLKSPLTAVAGYSELLGEHLDAGITEPAALRPMLSRIAASASHMGALIDDLLSYATARDAQLHPAELDLTALAGDVAAAVQESLPPDRPRPSIEIDRLPQARADRLLVRQLLHDLLGNAVK